MSGAWGWPALIAGGFLLGSVMFSRLLPRLILHRDICALSPDGNPGAANVFLHCGVGWGLVCLLLDMAKGYVPVMLARMWLDADAVWFAAVMVAPVLGHALAPLDGWHGGKCIATAFGVVLGLVPSTLAGLTLAATYLFFSLVVRVRPHRRRSLAAFGAFGVIAPVWLVCERHTAMAAGCLVIAVIGVARHSKPKKADGNADFAKKGLTKPEVVVK